MFYFNIAVLSVSNEKLLDTLVNKLYDDVKLLKKLNASLVTIRKRSLLRAADAPILLNAWRNLNLIFFLGARHMEFLNDFSEEERLKIQNECPNLASLLLRHTDSSDNCFLNGTAIVCHVASFPQYQDHIQSRLSVFFEAALESRSLNHEYTFHVSNASCGFLSKSHVSFLSVADRPRTSPFSMVSVKEAIKCVLDETFSLDKEEKRLKDALNYILTDCVKAPEPYPPFNASIKDGYAVIASDPAFEKPLALLSVVGNTEMGHIPKFEVVDGTCARVSTGGMIPESANAVVQVEDTSVHSRHEGEEVSITFTKKPKLLQDIRVKGSDVPEGSIIVPARQKIGFPEIGILSIFGIQNVLVYKKPWVAVMSTGDEVIDPENPVFPGCIRDSNRNTLASMLKENHIPFVDVGIAKDKPDIVKSHLCFAMDVSDVIISTGGVSMGEKDVMKEVLKKDFGATIHFGRVHMKPGKPTTFSTLNFKGSKKFIFSLPGNPVSACVCFYLFVMPCIKKMMGYSNPEHMPIQVKLNMDLKLDERPEFCRATLTQGSDGIFLAEKTGDQQSSRLLSMQNADVLLILPPRTDEQQMLKAGTLVNAFMLKNL